MFEKSTRRYYFEFGAAMLAYVVTVLLSVWLLVGDQISGDWRWIVALLPVPPMFLVALAVLRQLRRDDELQRKIQFEALAIAFAGTALITFSYGFLENVGFPKLPTFAIWPMMGALWIVGLRVVRRHYR
jgi:peptidoglycan/LPS O-acetylase OafA/YrhL